MHLVGQDAGARLQSVAEPQRRWQRARVPASELSLLSEFQSVATGAQQLLTVAAPSNRVMC